MPRSLPWGWVVLRFIPRGQRVAPPPRLCIVVEKLVEIAIRKKNGVRMLFFDVKELVHHSLSTCAPSWLTLEFEGRRAHEVLKMMARKEDINVGGWFTYGSQLFDGVHAHHGDIIPPPRRNNRFKKPRPLSIEPSAVMSMDHWMGWPLASCRGREPIPAALLHRRHQRVLAC